LIRSRETRVAVVFAMLFTKARSLDMKSVSIRLESMRKRLRLVFFIVYRMALSSQAAFDIKAVSLRSFFGLEHNT
jgi:hypothetical protein